MKEMLLRAENRLLRQMTSIEVRIMAQFNFFKKA